MDGDRVTILVSGPQGREVADVLRFAHMGEVVTEEAVRVVYAELSSHPVVMDVTREVPLPYGRGSRRLRAVVGSVTDFALETLPDGRIAISGRLTMKYEQPRCAR